MKFKILLGAVGSAAMLFGATNAGAVQIACPANIVDNVTNTTACEYSSTADQDNTNAPLVVNTEKFFTFTDWLYVKKDELASNAGLSGTWSVAADFWTGYENGMLIFKDGAGTTLVGYLIAGGKLSGTWTTPFENPPFTTAGVNGKDVSHISFYRRLGDGNCCDRDLPEPGSLALFGLGLLGLGLSRRRFLSK